MLPALLATAAVDSGFIPHGYCFLWNKPLLWTHVTSDLVIGLSYVTIALTLGYLARQLRREIPFTLLMLAFGAFIIACGATHFIDVWTLWHPVYWFSGGVKVITAAASVTTACALPSIAPKVVSTIREARRSEERRIAAERAAALQESNEQLQMQALELEAQQAETEAIAAELEQMNAELRAATTAAEGARIAAEAAVAEKDASLAMLDAALACSPIGFAFFDLTGRCLRVNETLAQLHALEPGKHIGRSVQEVFPQLAGEVEPLLARVIATSEAIRDVPTSVDLGKGPTHWLANYYPVHSRHGSLLGVGVAVVDITAQRQMEEELRQAQKLEAVGQLAGGIAHDFNNLLTVIQSYSEMAAMNLASPELVKTDLAEISKAAIRAARLTGQLLAFSRRQVLEPRMLDLRSVVDGVEGMLRRLIREDIQLVTTHGSRIGLISADPGQIEQIIINLVVNARDAMPMGGRISIETSSATSRRRDPAFAQGHDPEEHYVMLTVSDTGIGMDAATIGRIFEPFFTTKGTGKGTGLGLSTVYGIVKQSGGHIDVSSEPGRGTTIKVFFPCIASDLASASAIDLPEHDRVGGSETILVVEDEEAVMALTRGVLEAHGYTVLAARDGIEALEASASHASSIDLLLTDVIMPNLGARGLVEQLGKLRPRMKVVFVSGYTDDDVRRLIRDSRVSFLQKPFTPTKLTAKVRKVLDTPVRSSDDDFED